MGFLDKVKKGLGTAAEGAKIASSMAIIKKDLEHAKIKKSKALKQLGEVVYNNKEAFSTEIAFSELLGEIEILDSEIEKLEGELDTEGKKFSSDQSEATEAVKETVVEVKEDVSETVLEVKEDVEETVVEVKDELTDQEKK